MIEKDFTEIVDDVFTNCSNHLTALIVNGKSTTLFESMPDYKHIKSPINAIIGEYKGVPVIISPDIKEDEVYGLYKGVQNLDDAYVYVQL